MELIHCYASILKPAVYPQVPFSSHRQLRLSWQARWCLLSVQRLNQFSCCMNHFLFFLRVFFCALLAFASSSKMRSSTRVTELPEKHKPCFHNNASKNCQFASFFSGEVVLTHSTSWQLSWNAAFWLGFVFLFVFLQGKTHAWSDFAKQEVTPMFEPRHGVVFGSHCLVQWTPQSLVCWWRRRWCLRFQHVYFLLTLGE